MIAETTDWTFMRFQVDISIPGFPDDEGEALAAEVKKALEDAAGEFNGDVTVQEVTE